MCHLRFYAAAILRVVKAGGWTSSVSAIPPNTLTLKPDATPIGYIFTNLAVTIASVEYWQRAFSAKSTKTARKGLFWGFAIYGISIPTVLGLVAFVLLPNLAQYDDTVDAAIPALVITILSARLTGHTFAGLL